MKRIVLSLGLCIAALHLMAQRVNVELLYDKSAISPTVVSKAENNLRALITEINSAYQNGRAVNTASIPMSDFAKRAISMLWKNVHFETRATDIQDKLWAFKRNKMMQVMHIPFVLRDDSQVDGDHQDAVVEFDLTGRIADFRFALDPEMSESMENYNEMADLENQAIITKYVEHFYTAYHEKDIDFTKLSNAEINIKVMGYTNEYNVKKGKIIKLIGELEELDELYIKASVIMENGEHSHGYFLNPYYETVTVGTKRYLLLPYSYDNEDGYQYIHYTWDGNHDDDGHNAEYEYERLSIAPPFQIEIHYPQLKRTPSVSYADSSLKEGAYYCLPL